MQFASATLPRWVLVHLHILPFLTNHIAVSEDISCALFASSDRLGGKQGSCCLDHSHHSEIKRATPTTRS